METEQDKAKHDAAKRWRDAVNNWGKLGRWEFHVTRDPHMLGRELEYLVRQQVNEDGITTGT